MAAEAWSPAVRRLPVHQYVGCRSTGSIKSPAEHARPTVRGAAPQPQHWPQPGPWPITCKPTCDAPQAGKLLLEAYDDFARHARLMTSIHARKCVCC